MRGAGVYSLGWLSRKKIMKKYLSLFVACLFVLASQTALACGPEQDGCLGCNDEELPVCLTEFVQEICQSSGHPGNCNTRRVYDDTERHVLISTGSHMSRMRAMYRGSRKYQLR
jgi:hypothetical protein